MNYVKQLNAFMKKSIGVLDAKEQAMYIRLFCIQNELHFPEWFSVSNQQLKRELKIGSVHTIIRVRTSLAGKGFIRVQPDGQGKMAKYALPVLYEETLTPNSEENEASTPAKTAQVETSTPAKIAQVENGNPCKNCTTPVQKLHRTPAKIAHIINNKHKHIATTTTTRARGDAKRSPPEHDEVIDVYQREIRPVCSEYELQKLNDDVEHFGREAVIKAIHRAVLRNNRSLGYVEGILRKWEAHGYDEEGDMANGQRGPQPGNRRGKPKAPRKTGSDWSDPNADNGGW